MIDGNVNLIVRDKKLHTATETKPLWNLFFIHVVLTALALKLTIRCFYKQAIAI